MTINCTARRSTSRIVESGYQGYRPAQDCPYTLSHAKLGEFAPHKLYGPYRPYSLLQMDRLTLFSERSAYIYRGYPIAMRVPDFENHQVEQGAVTTRAEYVGRTRYAALHELRLLHLGPLPSIDGLSGSPVFQVHSEEGTGYSREAFAGMLLRGSIESGRIFLIEHRRIIEVLTEVVQSAST